MPKHKKKRSLQQAFASHPTSVSNKGTNNSINTTSSHPYRKLDKLYTSKATLECALTTACIPCAYKIANFDIALDGVFTKVVPNTRPEQCPRTAATRGASAYGYQKGMRILTVGDGDFSFSLALARMLSSETTTSSTCMVATSYESLDTLLKVYPKIQDTIGELKRLDCQVLFEVDATNLMETLPITPKKNCLFHRIAWNFPCTAIANGQDGQNQQMEENKLLVQSFVQQCTHYLHPQGGEIHFLHKTKPPYDQWRLEQIAVQDSKSFEYKGRLVFDKCLLPPYTPRKAMDKKSFPCHDACLFVFGWKQGNGSNEKSPFEETIPLDNNNNNKASDDHVVVPVTEELIDQIRSLHLQHGSYQDRKKKKKRKD